MERTLAQFDRFDPVWYGTLLIIIIQIGKQSWKHVHRLSLTVYSGFMRKHTHSWSEWMQTNNHYWSHAKTVYRACNTCAKDEYRLVELLCPQYKIKKQYCHWCAPYAEEWQKQLNRLIFDGEFIARKQREENMEIYTVPEKKNRNLKIYEMCKEGQSYHEIAVTLGISRSRVHQIVKTCQKKESVLEYAYDRKTNSI